MPAKPSTLKPIFSTRARSARNFAMRLTERARAGVKVKLIIDFIGQLQRPKELVSGTDRAPAARVEWYHSLRLDLIPQINNRTHRELMVVDGEVGFIGGAGIDDHWYKSTPGDPRLARYGMPCDRSGGYQFAIGFRGELAAMFSVRFWPVRIISETAWRQRELLTCRPAAGSWP